MAVTLGIGNRTITHPAQKETLGNRLAFWALAKEYNIGGIAYVGPVFEKMETAKEGKIQLNFTYCVLCLTSLASLCLISKWPEKTGFFILPRQYLQKIKIKV